MIGFMDKCTVTCGDEEFHDGAEEPPCSDLFVAVHGGCFGGDVCGCGTHVDV